MQIMYNLSNLLVKPLLFFLKKSTKEENSWRDLSNEKMVLSYQEIKLYKKYSFREKILLVLLFIVSIFLLPTFNKKNNHIKKKVPENYYPLN